MNVPPMMCVRIVLAICVGAGAIGCGGGNRIDTPNTARPPRYLTNAEIVEELRGRAYEASETVPGVVVNLPDVYLFAFGSSEIGPEGKAKLRELAAYLNRPEIAPRRLMVEGHTDSIGTDAANQALSERRAGAVRAELLSGAVEASRIQAIGYGESRPVTPNVGPDGADNPAGRARNRRVEILIQSVPDDQSRGAPAN